MKLSGLVEKNYPYLQYPLYRGKLTNGLTVYLMPNNDFHEIYGMLTVQFGAVDTTFKPKKCKQFVSYPSGIAHFLEHKLFEMSDGGDILQEFSKLGAHANAYTSLDQTSYLFSTSQDVIPALTLLQRFVREASFTKESVERERGIVEKEIEMYQDDPDFRLYSEILASLYPQTPLQNDIAGSVESLQDITAEALYENFEVFYQPHNMSLFLIGNFDLQQVWHQILSYQSAQLDVLFPIERQPLAYQPILEHRTVNLEVAGPKLAIGLRGKDKVPENQLYRYRTCLTLLFSMLFGWTSKRYQELYEGRKIDSSFSFQLEVRPDFHFLVLTADTLEPIAISNSLRKAILNFETDSDVSKEHLQLLKKEAYGDFIQSLNSLEFTAGQFMQHASETEIFFDLPDLLEEIDLEEILEVGRQFISNCDMTDFIIFPK